MDPIQQKCHWLEISSFNVNHVQKQCSVVGKYQVLMSTILKITMFTGWKYKVLISTRFKSNVHWLKISSFNVDHIQKQCSLVEISSFNVDHIQKQCSLVGNIKF